MAGVGMEGLPGVTTTHTLVQGGRETMADSAGGGTLIDSGVSTQFSERATVAQGSEYNPTIGEAGTLIQADALPTRKNGDPYPARRMKRKWRHTRLSSEPETSGSFG